MAWVQAALGCVLQARGEYRQAATCLQEALGLAREYRRQGSADRGAGGHGLARRGRGAGGAAGALRAALGAALHPVLHPGHERAMQATRDALGEAAFAMARAEGRALPLEEAIALTLERIRREPNSDATSSLLSAASGAYTLHLAQSS
ncbi:MAG: hypothetical protein ACRDIE_18195, partial [Chloroflexota bacterium]